MTILDTIVLCVMRVITQELSRTLHLGFEGVEHQQKHEELQNQGQREELGQDNSCVLSTCYSVLLTVAPLLRNINPHTADRIASVVLALCTKIVSQCDVRMNTNVNRCKSLTDIDKDVEVISEALAVILQLINILLRPRMRVSNMRLLYALMHEGELLIPALQHGTVEQTVNPLLSMLPVHDQAVPNMMPKELSLLVGGYLAQLEERSRGGVTVESATTGLSVLCGIINDEEFYRGLVAERCMGELERDGMREGAKVGEREEERMKGTKGMAEEGEGRRR